MRTKLLGLISADAKFMNERGDIAEYIGTLKAGEGLSGRHPRSKLHAASRPKTPAPNSPTSHPTTAPTAALQTFVDGISTRQALKNKARAGPSACGFH